VSLEPANLPEIGALVAAFAQEAEPITRFTAETAASRPEIVARGFRFLIGAYTAVWTILAIYLLSISIRLRRLSQQVRRLKDRLGA
jgi:CcmD family protein